MLAAILGGAAGPWVAGVLYDATRRYSAAFWIAAACSILSMLEIWLARRPHRQHRRPQLGGRGLDARARVAHRPLLVDRRRLFLRLFAYAVQVHQTKYLIEIGFPLLVIELGVAAMGAGLLLGSLISAPWQLYLTLSALAGGGVNCLAYTGIARAR